MKNIDIDALLATVDFDAPRRPLSLDFSSQITAVLQQQPQRQSLIARIKEAIMPKKLSLAAIVALVAAALVITGGVTYAAVHHFSLTEMMNYIPARDANGKIALVTPEQMQQHIRTYFDERTNKNPDAYQHFTDHVSAELLAKMNAIKGADPVLCSQNIPESIRFESLRDNDSIFAIVTHFASGPDQSVRVTFDEQMGIFVDIRCPAVASQDAAVAMQGYYTQYIVDTENIIYGTAKPMSDRTAFYAHVTPELKARLEAIEAFDAVTCAQNIPQMVDYSAVTATSMTANVHIGDATTHVQLQFDPSSQKFISITCPAL